MEMSPLALSSWLSVLLHCMMPFHIPSFWRAPGQRWWPLPKDRLLPRDSGRHGGRPAQLGGGPRMDRGDIFYADRRQLSRLRSHNLPSAAVRWPSPRNTPRGSPAPLLSSLEPGCQGRKTARATRKHPHLRNLQTVPIDVLPCVLKSVGDGEQRRYLV